MFFPAFSEVLPRASTSGVHMFLSGEAEGQDLGQGVGFAALRRNHVDEKIVAAEFPHHLTAHAAGRERPGDDAVLSAAHGDGGKVPVAVIDRLEEGLSLIHI